MAGFLGALDLAPPVRDAAEARMAQAGGLVDRARLGRLTLMTLGQRDVGLAVCATSQSALVLSGYARQGATALPAADLLHRCQKAGAEALFDLEGEFSAALWLDDTLHLLRDAVGSRPLYVGVLGSGVVFGTSILPLLRAGVPSAPNLNAVLSSLILGYVPAPETAVAGAEQVAPAEVLVLAPGRRWLRRRHRVFTERLDRRRTLATTGRRLDRLVTSCVERALPDRGPIGAFLSGGLDSSLVLARIHEAGRSVQPYTLHFGDGLPGEIRYARAVTDHLGLELRVFELSARGFGDALPARLARLEDALSEPIAVPNFLLAREAAKSVTTLFTGEGGDPPFGGPKNIGLLLAHLYQGLPSAPSLVEEYLASHHHLADDLEQALTAEALGLFRRQALVDRLARELRPRRGSTFVGRLMRLNIGWKGGNNILVKVAKMVGAHDLALRSPLFDPAIIDFSLTIPPWQKLEGTDEKVALKVAARRSLPAVVLDRPKRGMAVPLSAWLRGDLGTLAHDVLTRRRVVDRGLFRWPYVQRLLRGQELPTELARSRVAEKLWMVLVTELHLAMIEQVGVEAARAA